MLAILDTLVPLLIFAVFVLVSYLQKRRARQEREEEEFGPPAGAPPRTHRPGLEPERRKSWEEELRELLENRVPAPPPVHREIPPAPPPIVFERPVEIPPPLVESHRHWQESAPSESEGVVPFLARFKDSTERLEEAVHLDEQVAGKLAEMRHRPLAYAIMRRDRGVSDDAKRAIALIRNPRTVRSAIVASLILSPPPALAD